MVGDLALEINGVLHETVDISIRSVAIVAREGVDYAHPRIQARFVSGVPDLNREVLSLNVTGLRRSLVILDYAVGDRHWEQLLVRHDVANEAPVAADIFG